MDAVTTDAEWWRLVAELHPDDAADVAWRYRGAHRELDRSTGRRAVLFDDLEPHQQQVWLDHVDALRAPPDITGAS